MKPLVEPLVLTEQQQEYILACYAAFQSPDQIIETFCECFPVDLARFKEHGSEAWKERLYVAIKHLSPEHPKFPEVYNATFSQMRLNYLRSHNDRMLTNTRSVLKRLNEELNELNEKTKTHPQNFLAFQRRKLKLIQEARKISYQFFSKIGLAIEDPMLSVARGRLRLMENIINELDAYIDKHKEKHRIKALDCMRLKRRILKEARIESDTFNEANANTLRVSSIEEARALFSQLTDNQLTALIVRYKHGEDPEAVLVGMLRENGHLPPYISDV